MHERATALNEQWECRRAGVLLLTNSYRSHGPTHWPLYHSAALILRLFTMLLPTCFDMRSAIIREIIHIQR